ncbi:MAG: FAD-binding protein [Mucilaginibacter polytrichastri]|nr:FAD-binding protein [Mucilaginibacter polytrichastri]
MNFCEVTPDIIREISALAGENLIYTDDETRARCSRDETEDLQYMPALVFIPENAEQIGRVLKFCSEKGIAVTPRGAGTGLSGGALPVYGGVVISMEKMNAIIAIDEQNLQARVQPGVITENLINAAAEKGLLYPIDPASKGSCFIGGNVSHGSGGPRVVKYGTLRDYILNLQIVLPSGEIIWTGADTLKFSSGYNLTQFVIGSEGTLGIVTEIVVKLIPRPATDILMMAAFPSNEQACAAVGEVFRKGIVPSSLEFMERRGVEWVMEYDHIAFDLKPEAAAFLLIELDGNNLDELFSEAEKVNEALEMHGCFDVLFADSAAQKEELWRLRRTMAVSVKSNSVYKEEDTVVPRAALPALISGIKETGAKYGFDSVCYGHAGDGNLHVNIVKGTMSDTDWNTKLKDGIREIFELTVSLGGTLSGEHGIGLVQKEFMPLKFSETHLALMRGIKQVFDPKGIMNPGKIF